MAADELIELIQKNGNGIAFTTKEATAVAAALLDRPDIVLRALGGVEVRNKYDELDGTWRVPKKVT